MKSESSFYLLHIVGKVIKGYLFIAFPIAFSFTIYLHLNVQNVETLTNPELYGVLMKATKEILSKYPFVEAIAKITSKCFKPSQISFQKLCNDILQSLICYGLLDWIKYIFNVRKNSVTTDTALRKGFKLVVIYSTWFFLTAYFSGMVLEKAFDFLDTQMLDNALYLKLFLLMTFFVICVLVFMYKTKEGALLSTAWILMDKIVFPVVTMFCLSLIGNWAFSIYIRSSGVDKLDVLIPIFAYIIIAVATDFLKNKTRIGIVTHFKKQISL